MGRLRLRSDVQLDVSGRTSVCAPRREVSAEADLSITASLDLMLTDVPHGTGAPAGSATSMKGNPLNGLPALDLDTGPDGTGHAADSLGAAPPK